MKGSTAFILTSGNSSGSSSGVSKAYVDAHLATKMDNVETKISDFFAEHMGYKVDGVNAYLKDYKILDASKWMGYFSALRADIEAMPKNDRVIYVPYSSNSFAAVYDFDPDSGCYFFVEDEYVRGVACFIGVDSFKFWTAEEAYTGFETENIDFSSF